MNTVLEHGLPELSCIYCAVDIPFVKVLFEWCRSDFLNLPPPTPHLWRCVLEFLVSSVFWGGFIFGVLFCCLVFGFLFFFKEREWKFYEVRIFLSFSSEFSLRENMAGGGRSSAQWMQTGVGGFLLLMCKVRWAGFFWGLLGAYPERNKGGRREGYHGKAVSMYLHSVEGMYRFFDFFGDWARAWRKVEDNLQIPGLIMIMCIVYSCLTY